MNSQHELTNEYRLDEQVGYLLRLATQRHLTIFQKHMLLDLTPTQFSALIRLAEVGKCSQNDLGRRTSVDVATIKGVVDRLVIKGLVVKKPNPSDRRQKVVRLTQKGMGLIARLHEVGSEVTKETLHPLKISEQKNLLALLRKLG